MGRVYVVQENNRMDYSDAERFGEVVFMTADEYKPVASSLRNQHIIQDVQRHMGRFDPDSDWLILTGSPVLMGYVFHLALAASNDRVVCLQWDKIQGRYKEVTFIKPQE